MKKIRIDGAIKLSDGDTTVGKQLHGLLEGMPTQDAKAAVRQFSLAEELEIATEGKKEWFAFEDADQQHIEAAVNAGAKVYSPRIIAPIQRALDAAIAFKGEEPKEK